MYVSYKIQFQPSHKFRIILPILTLVSKANYKFNLPELQCLCWFNFYFKMWFDDHFTINVKPFDTISDSDTIKAYYW